MENTNTTNRFQSYQANRNGRKVLVINAGMLKSGAPGLKIRPMSLAGHRGWSGGAYPEYTYGEPIWVRADSVAR